MVSTSETGNSGSSSAIFFWIGMENERGSVAPRTARVKPIPLSPLRTGKYMVAWPADPPDIACRQQLRRFRNRRFRTERRGDACPPDFPPGNTAAPEGG